MPAAIATKLGVKGGVLITDVRVGSFADEIGLAKGIVITEINRRPVTDESSYRGIVGSLQPGTDVAFVVRDPRAPTHGSSLVGGTLQ